ncbi:MAG: OPT/YSL family transporter [Deltaproteobacteria bacterium]|nr:OPT/YSL family transporter [Deltaproteobacteria bacterium]
MSAPADDAPSAAKPSDFPLDLSPLRDPEAIAARDRAWLEKVYDRKSPQLTVRAAVTGMLLGAFLSVSDLYIGLKIGWIFGMSITSSVLAFALFRGAGALFPSIRPLSMLENNTSQTAASAAAYMASAGLVSSIPAMTLLRKEGVITTPDLTLPQLMLWMLFVASLGVCVAVPLKRSMINAEQLRFPSGVVCAETIKTMHSHGREAMAKAWSLIAGGAFAAVVKFIVECKLGVLRRLPEYLPLPGALAGHPLGAWSLRLNTSLLLYAAGSIVGLRVCASLLLGALVNYTILGPWLLSHEVLRLAPPEALRDDALWRSFRAAADHAHVLAVRDPARLYVEIRSKWSVWPGTSLVVSSSIVAFAFRWKTVLRSLEGLGAMVRQARSGGDGGSSDPLAEVEVPSRWFVIGVTVCGAGCVYMQRAWFGVPVLEGIVSVAMAFVLSVVAARATGETNITPIGAMGKITQLLFGVLVPGNASANLMTATVTAGSAAHAADLLTEVKTGYLLGGAPRKQFWAQLLGVLAGSLACVPIYLLLAKPEKLGNELAVPAALAWASVAKLLKDGPSNLPQYALLGIFVGLAVGAALAVLEEFAPERWRPYLPSATGLGIALVIDANDSLAMFFGALTAFLLDRYAKDLAGRFRVSVASGIVAGEGLMGIAVIALRDVFHVLPH